MQRCPISCDDFDGEGARLAARESASPIDCQDAIATTEERESGL
jgi:hypothetical protein